MRSSREAGAPRVQLFAGDVWRKAERLLIVLHGVNDIAGRGRRRPLLMRVRRFATWPTTAACRAYGVPIRRSVAPSTTALTTSGRGTVNSGFARRQVDGASTDLAWRDPASPGICCPVRQRRSLT